MENSNIIFKIFRNGNIFKYKIKEIRRISGRNNDGTCNYEFLVSDFKHDREYKFVGKYKKHLETTILILRPLDINYHLSVMLYDDKKINLKKIKN